MEILKTTVTKQIVVCASPAPDFKPTRSCSAHDLILVAEGTQCSNCGNLTPRWSERGDD